MTKPETLNNCPNCGSNEFTLLESTYTRANICPNTGDLLCDGGSFVTAPETVTCDTCEHKISPSDFNIEFV